MTPCSSDDFVRVDGLPAVVGSGRSDMVGLDLEVSILLGVEVETW